MGSEQPVTEFVDAAKFVKHGVMLTEEEFRELLEMEINLAKTPVIEVVSNMASMISKIGPLT